MNDITTAASGALYVTIMVALYFLPVLIAAGRSHRNFASIALLNLFTGWTLIGWLAALIWSASDNVNRDEATK